MGQILVRNLDDATIEALKARAAARGISLEAEVRHALTRAASNPRAALADEFAEIRAATPQGPRRLAEELVREDRDRA